MTTPPWLHPACAGLICFTHAATVTASQLTAVAVQLSGLCSCTAHCVLQHSLGALSLASLWSSGAGSATFVLHARPSMCQAERLLAC